MANRYGVDTSVLVRLMTGQPPDGFAYCVEALTGLVQRATLLWHPIRLSASHLWLHSITTIKALTRPEKD